MPEDPTTPAISNPLSATSGSDPWHDLVAAVVALKGSPPVQPPSAMLGEVERTLGLGTHQALWWRSPAILGGMAATLAMTLGWLVWRSTGPREVLAMANGTATPRPLDLTSPDQKPQGGDTPSTKPAGAVSTGARIANNPPLATESARSATPVPRPEPFNNQQRQSVGAREGNPATGSSVSIAEIAAAPATRLQPIDQQIELKSDYYVVGMIAAALQSPVSDNPYEAALQPVEWTDWISGYELGEQLPPSEALALSETWSWQDPSNQSLAIGTSVGAISASVNAGIGEPMTTTPSLSAPTFNAKINASPDAPIVNK